MAEEKLNCVVLAGAVADEDIKARYNVAWRAQALLAGKPMIQWVLQAIRQSECVGDIVVVGAFQVEGVQAVPPGDSFLENVIRGVDAVGGETLLIAGSDIPLANGKAFAEIVYNGLALDADFVYPIIARRECLAKYPQLKRTFVSVSEGTFTGGNAILIKRQFIHESRERIEGLYQARKKPLKLASMIGLGTLVRFILAQKMWRGALDVSSIEQAAGRVMGGKLRALVSSWPEIGEDLDKLTDFEAAEELLAARV